MAVYLTKHHDISLYLFPFFLSGVYLIITSLKPTSRLPNCSKEPIPFYKDLYISYTKDIDELKTKQSQNTTKLRVGPSQDVPLEAAMADLPELRLELSSWLSS